MGGYTREFGGPAAIPDAWTPRPGRGDGSDLASILAAIGPSIFVIALVLLLVVFCAQHLKGEVQSVFQLRLP